MSASNSVLVTGGSGYIGSHTIVELLAAGLEVVCLDNFCNSNPEALRRVERIAGRGVLLVEGDIRDPNLLRRAFEAALISAVVQFAGLKAVAESVQQPLYYYDNNVTGSQDAPERVPALRSAPLRVQLIGHVYGVPEALPYTEDMPLRPINPYGATKSRGRADFAGCVR
jgi:UDP-glucose 4-epimerase